MVSSIPFSIAPDAEDFLRSRINEMPSEAQPVLMMATSQNDGLKSPRWSYQGESFVVGYFDPNEQPIIECSQYKLFGRTVAIKADALKRLSGHTLGLRRVDAKYGLFKNTRYVMVVDAPAESAGSDIGEKVERDFTIGALTILGGFTGMGVFWVVSAVGAALIGIPQDHFLQLKIIIPLFAIGWVLGAIVSFFYFRFVYKTDGRTKFAQEKRQRKYLGRGSLEGELNWWIFLGVPAALMAVSTLALLPLAHTDTQKGYGAVILLMVVLGGSMYFCDKMQRKWVFSLGISGWVLTFIIGVLFFKIHGP